MKVISKQNGNQLTITIKGALNEEAKKSLTELHQSTATEVCFDFERLESINSSGIRDWIQFIRKFEQNRNLSYANCPPDLIMTFNNIEADVGSAKVISLYRAYNCADCNSHHSFLLTDIKDFKAGEIPKDTRLHCQKCQGLLEPDEVAED